MRAAGHGIQPARLRPAAAIDRRTEQSLDGRLVSLVAMKTPSPTMCPKVPRSARSQTDHPRPRPRLVPARSRPAGTRFICGGLIAIALATASTASAQMRLLNGIAALVNDAIVTYHQIE